MSESKERPNLSAEELADIILKQQRIIAILWRATEAENRKIIIEGLSMVEVGIITATEERNEEEIRKGEQLLQQLEADARRDLIRGGIKQGDELKPAYIQLEGENQAALMQASIRRQLGITGQVLNPASPNHGKISRFPHPPQNKS